MLKPEEEEELSRSRKKHEEVRQSGLEGTSASLEAAKRQIKVQGVLDTPEGVVAIINNEIYRRGDKVAGAKLLRIVGNRVQFKFQGYIFEKKVVQQ